jgi:hypothetical protein
MIEFRFRSHVRNWWAPRSKSVPSSAPVAEARLSKNEQQLRRYADKARACGIDRLLLYLSFDCDTDEDAIAALELDPWLRKRGIRAEYAVPGSQLEQSPDAYRRIKGAGAGFLNHGARPHTQWEDDRYIPVNFYDRLAPEEVVSDILRGHEIIKAVLGGAPNGFRAPHFGCFQAKEQLELIYCTVRTLGYSYCSTTIPAVALENGPLIKRGEVFEIPLFGSYLAPTTLLDSWTYLEDRVHYRLSNSYFELFRDTVDYMLANDLPGVLAYYADPSHVVDQKPFLDAMALVIDRGVPSVYAEEIIARSTFATAKSMSD